jgi:hypothetical protein
MLLLGVVIAIARGAGCPGCTFHEDPGWSWDGTTVVAPTGRIDLTVREGEGEPLSPVDIEPMVEQVTHDMAARGLRVTEPLGRMARSVQGEPTILVEFGLRPTDGHKVPAARGIRLLRRCGPTIAVDHFFHDVPDSALVNLASAHVLYQSDDCVGYNRFALVKRTAAEQLEDLVEEYGKEPPPVPAPAIPTAAPAASSSAKAAVPSLANGLALLGMIGGLFVCIVTLGVVLSRDAPPPADLDAIRRAMDGGDGPRGRPEREAERAEVVRRAHLHHEALLLDMGGLTHLNGVVGILVGIALGVGALASLGAGERATGGGLLVLAVLMGGLGWMQRSAGKRLRAFDRSGRRMASMLFAISLLSFPLGTLWGVLGLYAVNSAKGKRVLSPAYEEAVRRTPHIKRPTSLIAWVVLLFLVVVFVGVLSPILFRR